MQYFLLGIALLVALVFIGRWFVQADPHRIARGLVWGGVAIAAAVLLLLMFSGRVMLLAALVPLAVWIYRMYQRAKAARGPSAGQSSQVRTRFLQMMLDHDSGALDGQILDGRYAGEWLSRLDLPALMELLQDYAVADRQSAAVLEAFLDRTRPEWRDSGEAAAGAEDEPGDGRRAGDNRRRGPAAAGAMTRAEALEILGLEEGADAEAVREAHRRLMQKLHPDHGGSNYLAAKLNEAKELLLRH
ncbi:MAG: hypothetical protein ACFCUW_05350 [Kiloniellaceae bacterium]